MKRIDKGQGNGPRSNVMKNLEKLNKMKLERIKAKAEAAKVKAEAKATKINAKAQRDFAKGQKAMAKGRNLRTKYRSAAFASATTAKFNADKEAQIARANALDSWNKVINNDATPADGTGEAKPNGQGSPDSSTTVAPGN